MKYLFDLPPRTPTSAILLLFGTLYTGCRVDKKRLIYIHRILKRHDQHWTKRMFLELDRIIIGLGKDIKETLRAYDLPDCYGEIIATPRKQWIKNVTAKVEIKNTKRLLDDCFKIVDGTRKPKTKTAHIIDTLKKDTYTRGAQEDILKCSKHEAKTLVIARFGMLECGRNYRGTIREICDICNVIDNEDHRLNHCPKFRLVNNFDAAEKYSFDNVFSSDAQIFKKAINAIEKVWNTRSAHGTMIT